MSIVEAAVGLGSNLGDRLQYLREARRLIAALPGVRMMACSPIYETEPVDAPSGHSEEWYLNAALLFEVGGMTAEEWSDALHGIEAKMGRVRDGSRNTPRPIDIDLLTFGNLEMRSPELTLPHPQCAARRFVCRPLADINPGMRLPGQSGTISEILDALPELPVVKLFAKEW